MDSYTKSMLSLVLFLICLIVIILWSLDYQVDNLMEIAKIEQNKCK